LDGIRGAVYMYTWITILVQPLIYWVNYLMNWALKILGKLRK
jgi:hypothetical protein